MQEEIPADVFYAHSDSESPEAQGLSEEDVSKLAEDQSGEPPFFNTFDGN